MPEGDGGGPHCDDHIKQMRPVDVKPENGGELGQGHSLTSGRGSDFPLAAACSVDSSFAIMFA